MDFQHFYPLKWAQFHENLGAKKEDQGYTLLHASLRPLYG